MAREKDEGAEEEGCRAGKTKGGFGNGPGESGMSIGNADLVGDGEAFEIPVTALPGMGTGFEMELNETLAWELCRGAMVAIFVTAALRPQEISTNNPRS